MVDNVKVVSYWQKVVLFRFGHHILLDEVFVEEMHLLQNNTKLVSRIAALGLIPACGGFKVLSFFSQIFNLLLISLITKGTVLVGSGFEREAILKLIEVNYTVGLKH
jgi:hypothetical protein